ncbi:Tex family protein [Tannerella forsythia]|uniref:Tex family protein n=1 Tax=Tannerella forsythia TaxID=28112 RepID=UPI0028F08B0A|nr:Tex family protein [Tannerella forsythia]
MHIVIPARIAEKLQISERQVKNTLQLLDDGATIPFISRYRKERTGGLDEIQIADISGEYKRLLDLQKRKETIVGSIEEQEKMTDELRRKIEETWSATELEDLYLPFKPKRRTRAQIACERGLEPLAKRMMSRRNDVETAAMRFVTDEVPTLDDALAGARDIIAEWINENPAARNAVRSVFAREALISSRVVKGKEVEGDKYRDYFEWSEPLRRISSHRLLAIRRGETEGILRVDISPDETHALERLHRLYGCTGGSAGEPVRMAVDDSYKRLLKPSIETEFAASSKEKADREAIRIFEENLRQFLLSPPLGQKRVMGIDPGFRTGCKVVCLDRQGNLLHNETIYPHPPQNDRTGAMKKIAHLVEQFDIQAIAVGNGTAGRETEQLVQNIRYDREVQVFSVSENGASIYSASKIAREEFPDYDVTVRGAVSLARRLMDPLAELVKIDPKSIGVGQYQHDVNQKALKLSLDQTVERCVNKVGVNVNTASRHLLTYVSGIGATLAQNIVDYRAEHGAFRSRKALMKVPKMGAKSFEQSAGFLRIDGAENPLDNSAVHPESYGVVEQMAADLHCRVDDLLADELLRQQIVLEQYVTDTVGLPTLLDIMAELGKPGRDPRETIRIFEFDPNVKNIHDLRPGMVLPGIVTNITKFGAFVDVGIKENGLVHVSQMADRFVSDPTEVVSLHQHVSVKVIEVDEARKRVGLSLLL